MLLEQYSGVGGRLIIQVKETLNVRMRSIVIPHRRLTMPRFAKVIVCCVLSVLPHVAYARGGPGAALGSAIVTLVYASLIPGALLGLAIRRATWCLEAQIVAALLLVSCTVFWTFGSSGVLSICILPVMAMASMTLAVSQLLIPENDVASGEFRAAGQWLAMTYLFWVAVSLLNIEFLGVFAAPVIGFTVSTVFSKFLPFVLPPLVLGIVISTTAILTLRKIRPTADQRLTSFVFNATLLTTLVLTAELYKDYLIDRALEGHHPTCVSTRSFISSLQDAGRLWRGPSHAYVEEDGKRYHWSYSERRFVDATGYKLVCEPQRGRGSALPAPSVDSPSPSP